LAKLMMKMYGYTGELKYDIIPDGDVKESLADLSLIKNKCTATGIVNLFFINMSSFHLLSLIL